MSAAVEVRTTAPLDAAGARLLTDRIRDTACALHDLLLEAAERKAWAALGYPNWREYATAEFHISKSRAYELLDQAKVVSAMKAAAGGISDMSEITARDTKALKAALPEVTEEIRVRVEAGEEPAEVVRAVVEEKREEIKAPRGATSAYDAVMHVETALPQERAPLPFRKPKVNTAALTRFIAAAVDAARAAETASDDQVKAVQANDTMLDGLRRARDLADRIIRQHTKGAA